MHRIAAVVLLSSLPACLLFDDNQTFDPHPPPPPNNTNPPPDPPCDNCTPTIPLDFEGVEPLNPSFPDQFSVNNHIAVGGTHEVTLRLEDGDTELPFLYDTEIVDTGVLAVEATDGPHVTLRGLAPGLSDLRILEQEAGTLFDRAAYAMSTFDRAVPVGVEEGVTSAGLLIPAQSYVFAPGKRPIGIAYLNALTPANRLVDTSAVLAAEGATQTRWDEITFDAATVGMHAITVTVGGVETTVEIEVTDTVDSIEHLLTLGGIACFGAFTHGAFVSGAPWQFTVDGQPYVPDPAFEGASKNCVFMDSAGHTIVATVGGKTITISI